jgi:hypothetical protein
MIGERFGYKDRGMHQRNHAKYPLGICAIMQHKTTKNRVATLRAQCGTPKTKSINKTN